MFKLDRSSKRCVSSSKGKTEKWKAHLLGREARPVGRGCGMVGSQAGVIPGLKLRGHIGSVCEQREAGWFP